jgi:DNA repair protein RecO (recombination protein O)
MPGRPPRVTKTEALVLRHRRLGEADRIVTLLTPLRGKIDVVAKGMLRTRSRMSGHLEPPVRAEVVLAHGRNMDIVTQAQAVDLFPALRADLDRLSTAIYLLELADRFTFEHAEAGDVYALLLAALSRLGWDDGAHLVTRTFELGLLEATGFRPEWASCVGCGAAVEASQAAWTAVGGGVVCPACRGSHPQATEIDARVLRVLRAYQSLPYEEAARIRLDPELMGRLELVMHALMRAIAERDLKSAHFVTAVRRAAAPASEDA